MKATVEIAYYNYSKYFEANTKDTVRKCIPLRTMISVFPTENEQFLKNLKLFNVLKRIKKVFWVFMIKKLLPKRIFFPKFQEIISMNFILVLRNWSQKISSVSILFNKTQGPIFSLLDIL